MNMLLAIPEIVLIMAFPYTAGIFGKQNDTELDAKKIIEDINNMTVEIYRLLRKQVNFLKLIVDTYETLDKTQAEQVGNGELT